MYDAVREFLASDAGQRVVVTGAAGGLVGLAAVWLARQACVLAWHSAARLRRAMTKAPAPPPPPLAAEVQLLVDEIAGSGAYRKNSGRCVYAGQVFVNEGGHVYAADAGACELTKHYDPHELAAVRAAASARRAVLDARERAERRYAAIGMPCPCEGAAVCGCGPNSCCGPDCAGPNGRKARGKA
jgi:NAD(P)-dependent dehydrogenase (short-subunit alcohol dehydrogenase family)